MKKASKMSDRVKRLREIAEEAVRSVQFIGDPGLRRAAFEKNLDTLLNQYFPKGSA